MNESSQNIIARPNFMKDDDIQSKNSDSNKDSNSKSNDSNDIEMGKFQKR
jgi:hypothetical protein